MRTVGLISVVLSITPHCLPLSPLVCHSNFLERNVEKNVHSIRGSMASVMCDFYRKLRGVQLFPLNTKDSGITSRLRHTSSWRKQPELSATSITSCSHPPKSATAYPNYPPGIGNSTGLCLLEKLGMTYGIHNSEALKAVDTELLWIQAVWSHRATDYLSFVKYPTLRQLHLLSVHYQLKWRIGGGGVCQNALVNVCDVLRPRNIYLCVQVHFCGIRSTFMLIALPHQKKQYPEKASPKKHLEKDWVRARPRLGSALLC